MKTRLTYLLIGVLLTLTVAFGAMLINAQSDYPGQRWEYFEIINVPGGFILPRLAGLTETDPFYIDWMDITLAGGQIEDFLKLAGEYGWEVVTADFLQGADGVGGGWYVFKRPLQ